MLRAPAHAACSAHPPMLRAPCAPQAEWLMLRLGQDPLIAQHAGRMCVMLVPCLLMDGGWAVCCVHAGHRWGSASEGESRCGKPLPPLPCPAMGTHPSASPSPLQRGNLALQAKPSMTLLMPDHHLRVVPVHGVPHRCPCPRPRPVAPVRVRPWCRC